MKKIIPLLLVIALLLQSTLITPFVGAEDETGELKGAVYGPELITDGGFDNDILDETNPITSAGWRYRNSDHNSVIKENGEPYGFGTNERIFRVANNSYGAAQPISIKSGKTYRLKFDMSAGSLGGKLKVTIMYKAKSPAVWKFPIEKVYTAPQAYKQVISVTDYIDTTDLPVSSADSNGFFIWLSTDAGNIVNVDNFSLVEVSSVCETPLLEEDFEDGFSFDFENNLSADKKTLWQKINGNYWQVYGTEGRLSDATKDTTNGTVWVPYTYDSGANHSIRLRDFTSKGYYTYYLNTFVKLEAGVTYTLSVDINGRGYADDVGLRIRPVASIDDSGYSWDGNTYYANYATNSKDYFNVGTGTSFTTYTKSFTPTKSGWVGISFGCMGKTILFDNIKVARAGHTWDNTYTIDVMPTANTMGVKSIHCANCFKRKDITEITLASLSGQSYDNVLDFEEGCPWDDDGSVWYIPGVTGYTAANVYSGKGSIQQTVFSTAVTYTVPVDLQADTDYTVKLKYKTTVNDAAPFATVAVGADELGSLNTNSTFSTFESNFTAASADDKVTITFAGADCLAYIDDVCIVPVASEQLIDIACSSDENGTATVSDTKIVEGQPVTFTATANDGYVFDSWTDGEGTVVSRNSVYKAIGITEALSLKANFVKTPEADGNADFESADDYTLSGEAFVYTPEYEYYDETYKHHGTSSLRLDGYGGKYTDSTVLRAGKNYKISFWYYLPTATTATIQAQLGNSDTPVLSGQCENVRDMWYQGFFKWTPEEDGKLCINVFGGADTNVGGPVYIDDIKIEEYHTVKVSNKLGQYLSFSANEPIHNSEITLNIKAYDGYGKNFFGWFKNGEVTEADGYTKTFDATEDLTVDENTFGTPVYSEEGDTNGDGKVNIADLVYNNIKLSDDYTLGNDVDKSGEINLTDFYSVRNSLLGIKTEVEKDEYLEQEKTDIVGTSVDKNGWIYQLGTDGVMVREADFDSGLGGEPVEIIQMSDLHLFAINERDKAEDNPTVMSSYKYTYWGMNDSHIPNLRKAMEYASHFDDQTVITGDSISFLSWGGIEQVQNEVWAKDPSALITIGNHEVVMKNSGKVAETLQLDARYNMLASEWRHNIFYTSRIIGNKVMVVQMENSLGKYYDEQVEQLRNDIEEAREAGLIVLIFQHVAMSTNNPADTAVAPIRQSASDSGVTNFYEVARDMLRPNLGGATTEVYNLITKNADVVKGVFCGHMHSDFYTEILATTKDGTETVIPQYVLTSNAYDNGHVMKITVK